MLVRLSRLWWLIRLARASLLGARAHSDVRTTGQRRRPSVPHPEFVPHAREHEGDPALAVSCRCHVRWHRQDFGSEHGHAVEETPARAVTLVTTKVSYTSRLECLALCITSPFLLKFGRDLLLQLPSPSQLPIGTLLWRYSCQREVPRREKGDLTWRRHLILGRNCEMLYH